MVAVISSAIGGYLAGRMRTKITGLHTNEVFFRDTAHGFLAWAFATLITLAAATAYLANGAFAGLNGLSSQSAQAVDPAQIYVDKLFRTTTPAADNSAAVNAGNTAAQSNTRAEILRLWKADFRKDADFPSSDRTYLAQVVAARTGISLADAGSGLIRLWLRPRSTPTTRDARPRIFRSGSRRHFYWAHSLQAWLLLKAAHCATALGTIAS
jgi:hypothetical protein